MAEERHIGHPKVLQFGDKTRGGARGENEVCAQCEAMLADALDGTLTAEEQALFDAHMAECGPCAQMLADARRGAAWLEMLRIPAPEPPAELLERILAQTSGAAGQVVQPGFAGATAIQPVPVYGGAAALTAGIVAPFRWRAAAALRASAIGQIVMQPRLAMTAAMAFFSIALTMNLLGIHPTALRPSDLRPSSLKRDVSNMNASVIRYYEGLRVVYELESRVHDLEGSDSEAVAGSQSTPAASTNMRTVPNQPAAGTGAGTSGQTPANGESAPQSSQPEHKKAAPGNGTSRREDLRQAPRFVLANGHSGKMKARLAGGLV